MSVLVVDDEPVMQELLVGVMEDAGVPVRAAGSGEEALALSDESWPSLFILDLSLPGSYSGWELWDALLVRARGRSLRVAITGAALTTAGRQRAQQRGALMVVLKPIRRAELARLVELGKAGDDGVADSDR